MINHKGNAAKLCKTICSVVLMLFKMLLLVGIFSLNFLAHVSSSGLRRRNSWSVARRGPISREVMFQRSFDYHCVFCRTFFVIVCSLLNCGSTVLDIKRNMRPLICFPFSISLLSYLGLVSKYLFYPTSVILPSRINNLLPTQGFGRDFFRQ